MKPVVLIDLENVKTADFGKFPADASVYIFVGEGQNKIDFVMVEKAQQMAGSATWVKIKGNGKNAADFHIAFFLGKLSSANPEHRFFILSKDKGFDPLVRHLNDVGIQCRRIENESAFAASKAKTAPAATAKTAAKAATKTADPGPKTPQAKIAEHLAKLILSRRPKSKKAMLGYILSNDRSLTELAAEATLNEIVRSGLFSESNGKIVYPEKK